MKSKPLILLLIAGVFGWGSAVAFAADKATTTTSATEGTPAPTNTKEERDLLVVSDKGQIIRLPVASIPVLGRDTQGVRIMKFKEEKDGVASVALV